MPSGTSGGAGVSIDAPKKSNHQVNIVRIAEVLPHPNADKLEIVRLGEYQAVVRKGDFLPGTLGVYIQPDSVVPQTEPFKFIWGQYVDPCAGTGEHPNVEVPPYTVSERRRRITVRKFRGEWSEGLLLPCSDFNLFPAPDDVIRIQFQTDRGDSYQEYRVGDDVSDLLGITHYDPDRGTENTKGENGHAPHYKRPKTVKGWFRFILRKLGILKSDRRMEVGFEAPVYDVEAWKNHKYVLQPGETVRVTEKIHGSNARYVYLDGTMYAGSRNLWKAEKSNCVWRKALDQNPWIEIICKANPGYILYGEVTPTQKGFDYGNTDGAVRFFLFDIRTPDGEWLPTADYLTRLERFGDVDYAYIMVPTLGIVQYSPEAVKVYVDGKSLVEGAEHIREGIVVRPVVERREPGLGRVQLKLVSNSFLERDSKVA